MFKKYIGTRTIYCGWLKKYVLIYPTATSSKKNPLKLLPSSCKKTLDNPKNKKAHLKRGFRISGGKHDFLWKITCIWEYVSDFECNW